MKSMLALLILIAPLAAARADSNPDGTFFKKAAEGGIAEVDAGNLAQQKGNNQPVKDFGAMMVKDHSAINDKLQALAGAKNISLPSSASTGEMAAKAKLDVLSGDSFDQRIYQVADQGPSHGYRPVQEGNRRRPRSGRQGICRRNIAHPEDASADDKDDCRQ